MDQNDYTYRQEGTEPQLDIDASTVEHTPQESGTAAFLSSEQDDPEKDNHDRRRTKEELAMYPQQGDQANSTVACPPVSGYVEDATKEPRHFSYSSASGSTMDADDPDRTADGSFDSGVLEDSRPGWRRPTTIWPPRGNPPQR